MHSTRPSFASTLAALAAVTLLVGLGVGFRQAPARDAAVQAVDPALAPLAFIEGRWMQKQANGATIEEHWMAPRGNSMVGTFRRTLGNGVTPFYEFTQVMAEKDMVILRQIHVHGNFETDPRRTDLMRLRLDKVQDNVATFVPVDPPLQANAQDMASVTYALTGPDTLTLTATPNAPTDPQKPAQPPLVFTMNRLR
jgi:hypothetical protein